MIGNVFSAIIIRIPCCQDGNKKTGFFCKTIFFRLKSEFRINPVTIPVFQGNRTIVCIKQKLKL
jgi:hypothetical protein